MSPPSDTVQEKRIGRFTQVALVVGTLLLFVNPLSLGLFLRLDPDAKIYLTVVAAFFATLLVLSILYVRTKRESYRRGFWAALAVGLVVLVAAELYLGRWRLQNVDSWRAVRIEGVYEPHDRLGWRPIPDSKGRHISEGNFDATYRIDSLGRKAIPNEIEEGPTLHVFGDSYTFGHGVDNEDTALNLLAGTFAKDHGFNVQNYAVMGYGLEQMYTALDLHRGEIEAGDQVVFAPTSFDLLRNMIDKRFLCQYPPRGNVPVGRVTMRLEGRWTAVDLDEACHPVQNLFLQSSFLVGFVYRAVRAPLIRQALVDNANAVLDDARELATDAGATFSVVFLAAPWECQKESYDFAIGDLEGDFDSMLEHCPDESLRFPTDSHWSPEGHRWVAGFLADRLRPRLTAPQH